MILIERGLGIVLMLLFAALGFGWGMDYKVNSRKRQERR